MIDRILSSLVALSLALLVWLYARSRDQEILDNVTLPVQISLAEADADHYSLEVNGAGPGRRLLQRPVRPHPRAARRGPAQRAAHRRRR